MFRDHNHQLYCVENLIQNLKYIIRNTYTNDNIYSLILFLQNLSNLSFYLKFGFRNLEISLQ
jgi:hypothetical protein